MKRLQTIALALTVLAVVILAASLVAGLGGGEAETPVSIEKELARDIEVEVLNAAGVDGLARAATRTLRERGVDVVYFGNAVTFDRDSSVVIDRVGRPEAARQVADVLGISQTRTERDSSLYLDATVLLGADWQGRVEGLIPAATARRSAPVPGPASPLP